MGSRALYLAVALVTAASLLTACGSYKPLRNTFEGRGDYRTLVPEKQPQDGRMFFSSSEMAKASARQFKKGDFVSIYLKRAYVAWFSEGLEEELINNLFRAPTKGELAVVANVTEEKLDVSVDPANRGKVIFYSGDVNARQTLNFSMVPVYGPTQWNGNPLKIDFTLMELDTAERETLNSLLGALAEVGTNAKFKQAPLVESALSNLGTALVRSNADDVIGRFTLTLVPKPSPNTSLPVLQEADYVVAISAKKGDPENERAEQFRWDCVKFDPATGLLSDNACPKQEEESYFKTHRVRYLVLTVLKNHGDRDQAPQATLNEVFQQAIAEDRVPRKVAETLGALLEQRLTWKESRENVERLRTNGQVMLPRAMAAEALADVLQCSIYRQLAESRLLPWTTFNDDVPAVCIKGRLDAYLDRDQTNWLIAELAEGTYTTSPDLRREGVVGNAKADSISKRTTLATQLQTYKERDVVRQASPVAGEIFTLHEPKH